MVPDVKEAARHPQEDPVRSRHGAPQHGQPQSHYDDADVLDAVICEEALEIMLAEREGHAEDAADDSEEQKDRPPSRRRRGEISEKPDQSVDPDLEDHAGEHGGLPPSR